MNIHVPGLSAVNFTKLPSWCMFWMSFCSWGCSLAVWQGHLCYFGAQKLPSISLQPCKGVEMNMNSGKYPGNWVRSLLFRNIRARGGAWVEHTVYELHCWNYICVFSTLSVASALIAKSSWVLRLSKSTSRSVSSVYVINIINSLAVNFPAVFSHGQHLTRGQEKFQRISVFL